MTFKSLVLTDRGSVELSVSACCFRVRFDDVIWMLSPKSFTVFRDYIHFLTSPEGFELNLYEPGKTVVMMAEHQMMSLMSLKQLDELSVLLEKAGLELLRHKLLKQYSAAQSSDEEAVS